MATGEWARVADGEPEAGVRAAEEGSFSGEAAGLEGCSRAEFSLEAGEVVAGVALMAELASTESEKRRVGSRACWWWTKAVAAQRMCSSARC